MEALEFYIVRNKDGKYLHSKGHSGYDKSWANDIKKAKVYTKKSSAIGQIMFWASHYPEFDVPNLILLIATLGEPIDQTERVKKSIKKKEINKAKRKLWRAEQEYKNIQAALNAEKSRDLEKRLVDAEEKISKKLSKLMDLKDE